MSEPVPETSAPRISAPPVRFATWLAVVWSTLFSVVGAAHLLFDPVPETQLRVVPDRFVELTLEKPDATARGVQRGSRVELKALRMPIMGVRGESSSGEVVEDLLRLPAPQTFDALSTFAIDVDTASYQRARDLLRAGVLPEPASVRPEELINAQRYVYALPTTDPLAIDTELAPHPLHPGQHLLRVGLQARQGADGDRAPVHLLFLVDRSGSMDHPRRMPLVRRSLEHLSTVLGPHDLVTVIAFDGDATVLLPPTPAHQDMLLRRTARRLRTGGGTNLEAGLRRAYDVAAQVSAETNGPLENRVVVLSDGAANIGARSHDQLAALVARRAGEGITLTSVSFGTDGKADARMEQLADRGDGYAVYIDGDDAIADAFGHRLGALVETVARDAKVQVAFDPAVVRSWRLVGYDNRQLADADFRHDDVDAGEVGAGHQVTALYELDLRTTTRSPGQVRLRWKPPGREAAANERAVPLPSPATVLSSQGRVALAAGSLGEALRYPKDAGGTLPEVEELLSGAVRDGFPEDQELLELVQTARALRDKQARAALASIADLSPAQPPR